MYTVTVLTEGYSRNVKHENKMLAGCTCTLVQGEAICLLVDPLGAWEKDQLIQLLRKKKLNCDDINHIVCTHGHSDHIGNLNLFPKAQHIVGWSINRSNEYILHPFDQGESLMLADGLEVMPTPGHTLSDISVIVHTTKDGVIVISGDLFEKEEDIEDPSIWRETAGSENPEMQIQNRQKILDLASFIIPGHGPMFRVTEQLRNSHQHLFQ